jgi:Tol biopolymer transport system component
VFLVSVDGTREVRLTNGPEVKSVIGWSKDASALYYEVVASDTGERHSSVWKVELREGRPAGGPSLIRDNLVNATFVPGQDRLLYTVDSNGNPIWSVALDPEARRVVAPPTVVVNSRLESPTNMGWMRDGQSFLYFRPARGQRPGVELAVHSIPSNEERVIPLGLTTVNSMLPIDEASLYVRGDQRARRSLLHVNVATGKVSTVDDPDLVRRLSSGSLWHRSFADPTRIAYFFGDGRLVERDLVANTEKLLYRSNDGGTVMPSPDGRYVTFLERSDDGASESLKVLSTDGGQPLTLHTVAAPGFIGGSSMSWSGDSRTVLFRDFASDSSRIWTIHPDGTSKALLLTRAANITQPRLSPDGRRVVFVAPEEDRLAELWTLENLPESRGTSNLAVRR